MNQDFGLSLTPGNARRLLRIQQVSNVELPEELNELAKQDTISEADFDCFVCSYSDEKRTIMQFLLDCDLRGIVQRLYHPAITEIVLLNAVRLARPDHIVIFTNRSDVWRQATGALFLDAKICPHFRLTSEEIDRYRSGVLIIDLDHVNYRSTVRSFGTEFQKTIVYDNHGLDGLRFPWTFIARSLFPTMVSPLYPKIIDEIPKAWKDKPIHLFSVYYNMCIFKEHITNDAILRLLDDKALHFMIQQYRHLFPQLG